jgi:enterochelin esterase-like enzyme
MRLFKIIIYLIVFVFILSGCNLKKSDKQPHIDDIDFYSSILGKDMKIKVYTPKDYLEDNEYNVLYFLPDYGGSVYTVMEQYSIAEKADKLISESKIKPLIIVAVSIEKSFGINSSEKVESIETLSGKTFNKGMYEDYVCKEVIPLIDSKYHTIAEKEGRNIGGYSMGGFAALHISFRNLELFSKVGGHSPSIFIDDFPDKTVSDWLYPNDDIRKERDPILIAQNQKIEGLKVFLDVEIGGSLGVKYLYDVLKSSGIDAKFHELSLSHGRESCNENMDDYLVFYSGVSE